MYDLLIEADYSGSEPEFRALRFRNFGERLWKDLRGFADIDLEEIDASEEMFAVRGVKKKDLGRVINRTKKIIVQDGFEGIVRIKRIRR